MGKSVSVRTTCMLPELPPCPSVSHGTGVLNVAVTMGCSLSLMHGLAQNAPVRTRYRVTLCVGRQLCNTRREISLCVIRWRVCSL